MKPTRNTKLFGRLLLGLGVAFFVVSIFERQPAFSGVGAALFIIGIVTIRKTSKLRDSSSTT